MTLKSSKTTTQPDLGNEPIGRLLFKLTLPSVVAQLINVLYNIVDRMYIGHIPETGTLALTGVGVTLPIIMAMFSFSSLICMGAAPRASIFLGRQDKEMAEKILSNAACLSVVTSVILTIVLECFGPTFLTWFGASPDTFPFAWEYLRIYGYGTIFVLISIGLNAFINSQGYAMWGMATVVIGAVLNIVLDPILIFTFGMGVQGAALSSVVSQAISAAFVLWFLFSKHSYLHIQKKDFGLDFKVLGPCLALGLSPFIMQFTESVLIICFNSSLLVYGGDLAVGSMTILSSVNQLVLLPLQGFSQGAQPILSYNLGAGKMDRILKTFKLLLISSIVFAWSFWAVCQLVPQFFAELFTSNPELISYTSWSLRIFIFGCGFMGIQIACQQTFIALGNAPTSFFLACFRKIILLIPLIYILPMFLPDKVLAIFLAEPIADTTAGLTAGIMFYFYLKKQLPKLIATNQKLAEKAE